MNQKNNARFNPVISQEIRERLARSRSSFQTLTRGIYPETDTKSVEVSEKNPSETNGNAARLNDQVDQAIQGSPDFSTPAQNESSKVCQDLSTQGDER